MSTEVQDDISRWVYREKVKMLYANYRHGWVLSLLVSSLLCYLAADSDAFYVGLGWWLTFASITLVRLWLVLRFQHSNIPLSEYELWYQRFFWLTLLAGIVWGAGAILIGATQDEVDQVFILMILIGVAGGSIPLLGMSHNVMLAFQLPMVIPYVLWLTPGLHGKGLLLLLVVVLYLVSIFLAMKRLEQNISTSLGMRYELEQRTEQLLDANEKLEYLTQVDSLTQLYNRRYFEVELEKEWKKARRERELLAMLIIDIDYFKLYNDTYGHAAGDECLRKVAKLISRVLHRPGDVLARIGGEEFVALLPGIDEDGAFTVAQAMQRNLQQAKLVHATSPVSDHVTVSIGIATTVPDASSTTLSLFKTADNALYKAKSKGRNQIVVQEVEKLESE